MTASLRGRRSFKRLSVCTNINDDGFVPTVKEKNERRKQQATFFLPFWGTRHLHSLIQLRTFFVPSVPLTKKKTRVRLFLLAVVKAVIMIMTKTKKMRHVRTKNLQSTGVVVVVMMTMMVFCFFLFLASSSSSAAASSSRLPSFVVVGLSTSKRTTSSLALSFHPPRHRLARTTRPMLSLPTTTTRTLTKSGIFNHRNGKRETTTTTLWDAYEDQYAAFTVQQQQQQQVPSSSTSIGPSVMPFKQQKQQQQEQLVQESSSPSLLSSPSLQQCEEVEEEFWTGYCIDPRVSTISATGSYLNNLDCSSNGSGVGQGGGGGDNDLWTTTTTRLASEENEEEESLYSRIDIGMECTPAAAAAAAADATASAVPSIDDGGVFRSSPNLDYQEVSTSLSFADFDSGAHPNMNVNSKKITLHDETHNPTSSTTGFSYFDGLMMNPPIDTTITSTATRTATDPNGVVDDDDNSNMMIPSSSTTTGGVFYLDRLAQPSSDNDANDDDAADSTFDLNYGSTSSATLSSQERANEFESMPFLDTVTFQPPPSQSDGDSVGKTTPVSIRVEHVFPPSVDVSQLKQSWLEFCWKKGGGIVIPKTKTMVTKDDEVETSATSDDVVRDLWVPFGVKQELVSDGSNDSDDDDGTIIYRMTRRGPFFQDIVAGSHMSTVEFDAKTKGAVAGPKMIWTVGFQVDEVPPVTDWNTIPIGNRDYVLMASRLISGTTTKLTSKAYFWEAWSGLLITLAMQNLAAFLEGDDNLVQMAVEESMPLGVTPEQAMEAWYEYCWRRGGGIGGDEFVSNNGFSLVKASAAIPATLIPPLLLQKGKQRWILSALLEEEIISKEFSTSLDRGKIVYRVNNSNLLTYPVHFHEGQVEFSKRDNEGNFFEEDSDRMAVTLLKWNVQVRPYRKFNAWGVKMLTKNGMKWSTRNLRVFLEDQVNMGRVPDDTGGSSRPGDEEDTNANQKPKKIANIFKNMRRKVDAAMNANSGKEENIPRGTPRRTITIPRSQRDQ